MARRIEIPALTGLRGIAALLVVMTHLSVWCAPYTPAQAPVWVGRVFDWSQPAMTLFFMLSGFVIAYNYWDMAWHSAPLRSFLTFGWLRFSRLYPAYLLFILISLVQNRPTDIGWTALHVFSLQSWLPAMYAGTAPGNGTFNVAWSLSTEWGLYALFAGALILLRRSRRAAIVIMLAGVASLYMLAVSEGLLTSVLPYIPRLGEMTPADEAAWLFQSSPFIRTVDFAMGAAAGVLVLRHPHVLAWRPLALVQKPLAWAPLVFVGEISYGLYLFHFLATRTASFGSYPLGSPESVVALLANMAVSLVFAIFIATGVYMIVEKPAQRWLRSIVPLAPSRARLQPATAPASIP